MDSLYWDELEGGGEGDVKWKAWEVGKKNKVHCRNSRPLTIACHMKNLYLKGLFIQEL